MRRAARAALAAVALLLLSGHVHADAPRGTPSSPTAFTASSPADADVAGATRELGAWLDAVVSSDPATRRTALTTVERASPAMMPAISERLVQLSRSADRAGMAAVIAETVKPRPVNRDEIAGRLSDGGFDPATDWWLLVMASPAPDRAAWRDLASVLGISRLLARIATTPAARELGALFVTYGDLLRPDLERQLVIMGDRALPALIEMRRAESKEQRLFALKLLEALGKAIPGEAVQTGDDRLLVEVLLAYGRAKEVDAAKVILSFANSDRRQIRDAARQAVLLMGEAGAGAVRESYENMTNQKSPEGWGAENTARELFRVFDRARLAEAYALMDEGLAALREQDSEKAAAAFDRVLARDPAFEKRAEMAPAFLAYGRALKKDDPSRALANFRKAMRVAPSSPDARFAEAELLVLEAKDRAAHGLLDDGSLRHAIELDPSNADAKAELARIEAETEARSGRLVRYFYGALGALLAVGGLVAAMGYRRRSAG